jgi:tetrapyrrole methylase family protein/MazG family protein
MANQNGITLLGLGPAGAELLTREAWDWLNSIPEVYVRTKQHPAVLGLPGNLTVHSFDSVYEHGERFEDVYEQIIEQVLTLGKRPEGVTYAVPGHPFIAETTGPEIQRRAREQGIPVRVIEGISFLEPLCSTLGVDPFPHTALVDALEVGMAHHVPFPPDAPAIIAQVYSQAAAAELKMTLLTVYPDQHLVRLVHGAGTENVLLEDIPLYEIDRSIHTGLLTALYLPPLAKGTSLESFEEIIAHLRAPDGCPWDREQTHLTLRQHLMDETYEALEALDHEDSAGTAEELGDLLLQIVLHAEIASEEGDYQMKDIIKGIYDKIVRRHPHVFTNLKVDGVDGVLTNWEKLKAAERKQNGNGEKSSLDGVPSILPALAASESIQDRAARVGFDWPDVGGVLDKIREEIGEVESAPNEVERSKEIGDVFFALVNLARWYKIDAESALRETNQKFRKRFAQIEKKAREEGRSVSDMTLDEMNQIWEDAKKLD